MNLLYILRRGVGSSLCTPYSCLVFQMEPGNVLYYHNRHLMGQFALKGACWCVQGEVQRFFSMGAGEQSEEEVCLRGLGLGGDYEWCLVVAVIITGLGGVRRVERDFKVMQEEPQREGPIFRWGGSLPTRNYVTCAKVCNAIYYLEAYAPKRFISNIKARICFLSMTVQLGVVNNHIN